MMFPSVGAREYGRGLASLLIALGLLIHPAGANELSDEYAAYQEAAAAGDLHTALPHARRAYELGLEQFGPEDRNTGLLAFNYGSLLYEARELSLAGTILNQSKDVLTLDANSAATPELFDTELELARVYTDDPDVPWHVADTAANSALTLAEDLFGESSFQAGLAHLQIAYNAIPRNTRRNPIPADLTTMQVVRRLSLVEPGPGRVWDSLINSVQQMNSFQEQVLRPAAAKRAGELLDGQVMDPLDTALYYAVEGYYCALNLDLSCSTDFYEAALVLLEEQGVANDNVLNLLLAWQRSTAHIGATQASRDLEGIAMRLAQVAMYRTDGAVLPVAVNRPGYPGERGDDFGDATVSVTFDVSPSGGTQNVELVSESGQERFSDLVQRTVADWTFLPAMRQGAPVQRPDYHLAVHFVVRRQTLHQTMNALDDAITSSFQMELELREQEMANAGGDR